MKVKIIASDKNKERIKKRLQDETLLESNDQYDIIIVDPDFRQQEIIGKTPNNELVILKPSDIIYIESYGHEILCQTSTQKIQVKEKLYELEGLFSENGFIRVHKSFVINRNHIKSIKPTLNTKFILTMSNKDIVEVSRSYYYIFKQFIGI